MKTVHQMSQLHHYINSGKQCTVHLAHAMKITGLVVKVDSISKSNDVMHLHFKHGETSADTNLARYTFVLPEETKAGDLLQISFWGIHIPAGAFAFNFESLTRNPFKLKPAKTSEEIAFAFVGE